MPTSPSTQNTLTIEEMDLSITALTYEIDELNKSYGIKSDKIKEIKKNCKQNKRTTREDKDEIKSLEKERKEERNKYEKLYSQRKREQEKRDKEYYKQHPEKKSKSSIFGFLGEGCGSSKKTQSSNITNQTNSQIQIYNQEEFERIKAENERLQREKIRLEQENVKLGNQSNTQTILLNKHKKLIDDAEHNEACENIAKTNGLNQGDSNDQRTINIVMSCIEPLNRKIQTLEDDNKILKEDNKILKEDKALKTQEMSSLKNEIVTLKETNSQIRSTAENYIAQTVKSIDKANTLHDSEEFIRKHCLEVIDLLIQTTNRFSKERCKNNDLLIEKANDNINRTKDIMSDHESRIVLLTSEINTESKKLFKDQNSILEKERTLYQLKMINSRLPDTIAQEALTIKKLQENSEYAKTYSENEVIRLNGLKAEIQNPTITKAQLREALNDVIETAKKNNLRVPQEAESLSNILNLDTYLKSNTEIVVK